MSTQLSLLCYVHGDDSSRVFNIEILGEDHVAALKDAIKEKLRPDFEHIRADSLVFWKVSVPTNRTLKESVEKLSLADDESLDASDVLEDVFEIPLPKKRVHVVVGSPPPTALRILYYVQGDGSGRPFEVEIARDKSVAALKVAIKNQDSQTFQHADAKSLDLWKASIPIRDNLEESLERLKLADEARLNDFNILGDIFQHPLPTKTVHIVVGCLPEPKRPKTLLSTSENEVNDDLAELRQTYLNTFPALSPSQLALPKADCEAHQPTRDDHLLALSLSYAMSDFYIDEKARQTKFIELLGEHGCYITPGEVTGQKYTTDGDIRVRGYFCLLTEFKNEVGSEGAEPVFQMAAYYASQLKSKRAQLRSVFPCIGLYIFGPTLGFVGLAFTDRVNIQILEQPMRLDYHPTDFKLRATAARCFGAMRKALAKLEAYYENLEPDPENLAPPNIPCYVQYMDLDNSVEYRVIYSSQIQEKLLFFGSVKETGVEVCVKFVTSYSRDAHRYCASRGIAPKLRGFEELPGGWFMVVMDRVDDRFETGAQSSFTRELHEAVLKGVESLHQAGYVHGDLREENVMVGKGGSGEFMLVDFDWAGGIGTARYPMNVNKTKGLWRPDGAYDEELIKAEHDIAMVQNMFRVLC